MRADDGSTDGVVDWTILKSVQRANAASMGAMEEYLLVASHPDAVGSAERTRELLERSIDRHERIIEQLELAVVELEAETRGTE
jgi:hypothetical protein